jgi:hypothetical protein
MGVPALSEKFGSDRSARARDVDQIQKFLGHSKLETTQIYAESKTEMGKEGYRRALAELCNGPRELLSHIRKDSERRITADNRKDRFGLSHVLVEMLTH